MNYSLYHDILPSPSKKLFQKDFYIKDEINSNNEILTKVCIFLYEYLSIIDLINNNYIYFYSIKSLKSKSWTICL